MAGLYILLGVSPRRIDVREGVLELSRCLLKAEPYQGYPASEYLFRHQLLSVRQLAIPRQQDQPLLGSNRYR